VSTRVLTKFTASTSKRRLTRAVVQRVVIVVDTCSAVYTRTTVTVKGCEQTI